ncbi:SpoIIE family protein phosphatase [Streptomyces sp. NPDC004074]|uniref:SpoIIE family protein phosphatase n=1 Tax=unclassified Streptomyces TaxID=2593676 RepID=UPI0033B90359
MERAEGSLLALCTDGLIEARDQDISAGMNRLRAALARPHHTLDDLCSSTVDSSSHGPTCSTQTRLLLGSSPAILPSSAVPELSLPGS